MNIKDKLDAINEAAKVINEVKENDNLLGVLSGGSICIDNTEKEKTKEDWIEILNWFIDGGEFTVTFRQSTPYGKRKNSKEVRTTHTYVAKKGEVTLQVGHENTLNYNPDFWEAGAEAFVNSVFKKDGEFSYYNNSFLSFLLDKGVKFKDLGKSKYSER